ncbi:MAG: 16S rRNA (adenine(1518)-N(6)/adenine(1519)-N(6))-dimethyltransferase RsmA [Microthrixaceae bacterium]
MLGATEINELLDRYGLTARKALGQNFVADPNTVMKIARLAQVGPGDNVIEIGPGLGSLTLALVDTGARVLAIEKDDALMPVLSDVLQAHDASDVQVIQADALLVDWPELLATVQHEGESTSAGDDQLWTLVANLPYNTALALIMNVLAQAPQVQRMVVMVQSEVADRLVAGPGGRTIGIPSIRLAWFAQAELLGTVPPEVFVPRPRVTSALVGITRREPPTDLVTESQLMDLVSRAYSQRRKMLRSTLGKVVAAAAFESAGVASTARPEELDIQQWARLAEAVLANPTDVQPNSLP